MPIAVQRPHQYQLDAKAVGFYLDHPVEFVEDLIIHGQTDSYGRPMILHETQKEALTVVAEGYWPIISAGRGVGKTALIAWVKQWWMYCHPTAKIPVLSTKQDQLKRNVWPECAKWLETSLLKDDFVWEKTKIYLKGPGKDQTVYSYMTAGDTREAFQGAHDEFLLVIADESSGIKDEVFEAMLGSMTQPMNAALLTGNPTQSTGFFIETFEHPTGKWVPIHIPCIDEAGNRHPNVIEDFITYHRRKYGEDSSVYRVYVLGLKPKEDPDTLIPWEWISSAAGRDVVNTGIYRVVWGVDVARFGDDLSALAKRQGNHLLSPVQTKSGLDTMEVSGWIQREYEDTEKDAKPAEILVDVIGIGAGVVDRCRENGLPVRGINVGEAASTRNQYRRFRDELWWRAREWFQSKAVRIPEWDAKDREHPMQLLVDELSALKYKTGSDGKIDAEPKPDFKKRKPLIGSPDRADAFVLTFAGGLDKIEEHQVDRWKQKKTEQQKSWRVA